MTKGVSVFISNSPFLLTNFFVFLSKLFLPEKVRGFCFRYFNTCSFFKSCKFPWSRFTIHSLRNRMNSFGEFWRNCILHLGEKCRNAWRIERFCVVIVQNSQMFQLFRYVKFSGFFSTICTVS